MKLVKIENYQLQVTEELLLLVPFRNLYKKDKTKGKQAFVDFLTIVYYVYDPRSDYSYIVDDQERLKEVCQSNGFEVPKFSTEQKECIELYKQLTTTISQELLKSTKIAIGKVKDFLEKVDLTALDKNLKPIYTISSITAAIKQIPQLAKDVMEAERAVAKEIQAQGRIRGGGEKQALFKDGI